MELHLRLEAFRQAVRNYPDPTGPRGLGLYGVKMGDAFPACIPDGVRELDIRETDVRVLDGATLPTSITTIRAGLTRIHTVRNLDKLKNLEYLQLPWNSSLETIEGPLPDSLRGLNLAKCISLTRLPPLGRSKLEWLSVSGCSSLTTLPSLPPTLEELNLERSSVSDVPLLPESVTRLILRGGAVIDSAIESYHREERLTAQRKQFRILHEELMASCWHPRRVEAWLTQGEDVLDMMMGV